jgi:hypothetical protein
MMPPNWPGCSCRRRRDRAAEERRMSRKVEIVSEETKPNKFEIRRAKRNAMKRSWNERNPDRAKAAWLRSSEKRKQTKLDLDIIRSETPPLKVLAKE